ncbi:hypothetical protein EPN96_09260 [bacterium]|nr:MAG: hypothetical protein EPN96_09260 [bacterium]
MERYGVLVLLFFSNIFMTYAWYGHLKDFRKSPLVAVILLSWGVAFFEYCLQVPANRFGHSYYTVAQLKVMQEVITMVVFGLFSVFYSVSRAASGFRQFGRRFARAARSEEPE